MTPHPQATELMAMAADTGAQMQRIARDLKVFPTATRWENCTQKEALQLIAEGWGYSIVRVKPRTIMIGDVEVPEPIKDAPEWDAPYWFVDLTGEATLPGTWKNLVCELHWLRRGLLQGTEQGAKEMLDALLKQLGGGHE